MTLAEISLRAASSNLAWSKAMRERLLDSVDLNGDGVVDFSEFVVMCAVAGTALEEAQCIGLSPAYLFPPPCNFENHHHLPMGGLVLLLCTAMLRIRTRCRTLAAQREVSAQGGAGKARARGN
eukprot:SAG11_NODE_16482_length_546_cov_0.923937_1_plen_122_part_01